MAASGDVEDWGQAGIDAMSDGSGVLGGFGGLGFRGLGFRV